MCLYPTLIRNRKYTKTKKNGGLIPPVTDERVKFVPIGCGNCMECRKQKQRAWQVRMLEDIKYNRNGKFVTFTFSNEAYTELAAEFEGVSTGYDLDNAIATLAVRRFLERWRKQYKKSLRHWLVTELGHNGTENIHLHGIIWTDEPLTTVAQKWQYGFTWTGDGDQKVNYVNAKTVNYITKYVSKVDKDHLYYKSIVLTSPGIGNGYTKKNIMSKHNRFNGTNTIEHYRTDTGHKIAMPIYWRNKIYTDEEREKLWLYRLDKNERWVCGEKIRADDTKNYYGALAHYRRLNKELGYGTNEKNWSREKYELERRELLQKARIITKPKSELELLQQEYPDQQIIKIGNSYYVNYN